jgi:hypothetical protein
MDNLDPERERKRLSALYSAMSDGELQKLAEDAASLTEVAIQMLSAELQRRGNIALAEPAAPLVEVEQRALVVIQQFRDMPEALLAKGVLDSAGIECHLFDDNMVRLDWFISNLLGGVKLAVRAGDAAAAIEILELPTAEVFEVEGLGKYEQPHCPRCESVAVRHEAYMDKRFALPALVVAGLPVPVPRNVWKCDSCGEEWRDRADELDNQSG